MSALFSYRSDNQFANYASIVKGASDFPSVFIDFSDGAISSAVTLDSVGAVAISSTGSTITVNCVGTTGRSGLVARVDLRTGGGTVGTAAASEGDRYRVRTTAVFSNGGTVFFDLFVFIDSTVSYNP